MKEDNKKKLKKGATAFAATVAITGLVVKLGPSATASISAISVAIDHIIEFSKNSSDQGAGTPNGTPEDTDDNYQLGTGNPSYNSNNSSEHTLDFAAETNPSALPANYKADTEDTSETQKITDSSSDGAEDTSEAKKATDTNKEGDNNGGKDNTKKGNSGTHFQKGGSQSPKEKTDTNQGGIPTTGKKSNTYKASEDTSNANTTEQEGAEAGQNTNKASDNPYTHCEFTANAAGLFKLITSDLSPICNAQVNIKNTSIPSNSGYTCSILQISNTPELLGTNDEKWIHLQPGSYTITFNCFLDKETTVLKFTDDLTADEAPANSSIDNVSTPTPTCDDTATPTPTCDDSYIEEVSVPMFESCTATVNSYEDTQIAYFVPQYTFTPEFDFISENDIDGVLQILDSNENILYSVNLIYYDDGSSDLDIEGDAPLNEGERYYLYINPEPDCEYSEDEYVEDEYQEYKYDFKISDIYQEEDN